MIMMAVGLGIFLENYESKNPCPSHCMINHEHIISNVYNDSDEKKRTDYIQKTLTQLKKIKEKKPLSLIFLYF